MRRQTEIQTRNLSLDGAWIWNYPVRWQQHWTHPGASTLIRLSFGWFGLDHHDVIMLKLITIIFALSRYHNKANSKLLTQWPPAAFHKYLGGVRTCHIKVTLTLAQIWRDRTRDFSWLLQYFLQTLRCEFCIFVYMQYSEVPCSTFHIHINWQSSHEMKMISLKKLSTRHQDFFLWREQKIRVM